MPFFRPATIDDLKKVNTLVNSAYRGESSRAGWTTEADLLGGIRTDVSRLEELVLQSDSIILLAFDTETEGQLRGCVSLIKQHTKENKTACYLGMLTVDPKLQAKGLGTQILKKAETLAREWGCFKMRMTVIDRRDELLQYYERRGYARTGEWEPFPDHDPANGVPKVENLRLIELVKKL